MEEQTKERIRRFRLHSHHLDDWYPASLAEQAAGACGLQNSPPGAWQTALYNRVQGLSLGQMEQMLEEDKTLLQAWSFRGAPVVFPTAQSPVFLGALAARGGEEWIYTRGIQLALDRLHMPPEPLLALLCQVLDRAEGQVWHSKTALDQDLARQMLPLLPPGKEPVWNSPSPYGSPDKQTLGGAVVSFLLRPCSFLGRIVFGPRRQGSPTFAPYRDWVGQAMDPGEAGERELVRRYLHCYGPGAPGDLAAWLGCSTAQARRLWQLAAGQMEPIRLEGKTRYLLAEDRPLYQDPPAAKRPLVLLGAHDPYLDLRDRAVVLEDKKRQRQVWQTVSNPGAIVWQGEVVGLWRPRKKGAGLAVEGTLWAGPAGLEKDVAALAEAYGAFRQTPLGQCTITRE